MFVGAIFRSSTQLANLSKTIVFTTYLHVFTLWKNIMFDTFDDLYHYLLWHWFWMRLGIALAYFSGNKINVFGQSFLGCFVVYHFYRFSQNWLPKADDVGPLLSDFCTPVLHNVVLKIPCLIWAPFWYHADRFGRRFECILNVFIIKIRQFGSTADTSFGCETPFRSY